VLEVFYGGHRPETSASAACAALLGGDAGPP
jgi:hypothetical protein